MEDDKFMSFLNRQASQYAVDKSYMDKILGRREVEELRALVKKNELTRQDLLELLYLLTSTEIKLVNLSEYDRYVLGKYFTWIRDLVKLAEFLYDFEEQIKNSMDFDEEMKQIFYASKTMILHDVKFAVDIFLYLSRSTLSVDGVAFDKLSKSRFEYEYGKQEEMSEPKEKKFVWWR